MNNLRYKVRNLREQGLTYREIQGVLGKTVPKSTLSSWCIGIKLTSEQRKRINVLSDKNLVNAREIAAESQENRREKELNLAYEDAVKLVSTIRMRDAKIALAMLYLGEGYKHPSYSGLRLGSSAPDIVLLYIRLLKICFNKDPYDLKCIISHRADQDLDQLIVYWSALTKIPGANFYRSKPDPRTVNKPTKGLNYMGVATISCPSASQQRELAQIAIGFLAAKIEDYGVRGDLF
jgi:hypothetical protein